MSNLSQPLSYALSFVWGLSVLAAFIGWGKTFETILRSSAPINWGRAGAYGIGVAVLYGGLLNLTHLISQKSVFIFVAAGCLLCIRAWILQVQARSAPGYPSGQVDRRVSISHFLLLLTTILALFYYGGNVWGYATGFNADDDYQGYFVFAERMLQEGHLPHDPFNLRRLRSSLGGHDFLSVIGTAVGSESNMNLVEPGLASLVAIGTLLGIGRGNLAASPLRFVPALLLLVIPLPARNVTSLMSGIALLLALFGILRNSTPEGRLEIGQRAAAGLIVATLCAFRNTYLAQVSVIVLVCYLPVMASAERRRKVVEEILSIAGFSLLFLSPWLLASAIENHTLMYPYTGTGSVAVLPDLSIAYLMGEIDGAMVKSAFFTTVTDPLLICTLVLQLFFLVLRTNQGAEFKEIVPYSIGLILAALATEIFTIRYDPNGRYSFPLFCTAFLVGVQGLMGASTALLGTTWRRKWLCVGCVLLISAGYLWGKEGEVR
ncbi:MAG: hypothetical protein HOH43_10250, partial [Candidatus Latescibacteria bacterium]|nr:hypothetical protein [Candidatus Latescibacterota bacterium]